MPISRICPRCGLDLARQGPEREPIYGLLVVVCGRCGGVMPFVRARDQGIRRVGAVARALPLAMFAFGVQVLGGGTAIYILSQGGWVWAGEVGELFGGGEPKGWAGVEVMDNPETSVAIFTAVVVAAAALVGMLFAITLWHWRWWALACAVIAALYAAAGLDIAAAHASAWMHGSGAPAGGGWRAASQAAFGQVVPAVGIVAGVWFGAECGPGMRRAGLKRKLKRARRARARRLL